MVGTCKLNWASACEFDDVAAVVSAYHPRSLVASVTRRLGAYRWFSLIALTIAKNRKSLDILGV